MRPLVPDPQCVHEARSTARAVCAEHEVEDDRRDDVVLVTSELVGNAIRHGAAPLAYDVRVDGEAVLVVVEDSDARPPSNGSAAHSADEGGRGLFIVDQLARDWGWTWCRGRKRVWATL